MLTVYITNDIDGHTFGYWHVDQAGLTSKCFVRAEHDFPHVAFWKCLAFLEPCDHGLNELERDAVFAIFFGKYRTGIAFLEEASPCRWMFAHERMRKRGHSPSAMISLHRSTAFCSSPTSMAWRYLIKRTELQGGYLHTFSNSILRSNFCVESSCDFTDAFAGSICKTFLRSDMAA